jgi:D-glycero-D-manno-heptose 1,7-bisphosphate phosphatase
MSRAAVFLDRDGTLNVAAAEHEYITGPEHFVWLDGAPEAIKSLVDLGYLVAVVSNQRGVGRGLMEASAVLEIEARMQADLASLGCRISAFRYCFHLSSDACSCRKPAPGMIFDLADEFDVVLEASWMVGDSETDVQAGQAAGCRTALLGGPDTRSMADTVVASLSEFVRTLAAAPDLATPAP